MKFTLGISDKYMTVRNKTLIELAFKRDLGLCACCGFKADEVHHIVPLSLGGSDELDNLVCLCSFDHKHAPNTKEEFQEYVKHHGLKLDILMGRAINTYYSNEKIQNEIDLQTAIKLTRDLIKVLREIDISYCIEKYG